MKAIKNLLSFFIPLAVMLLSFVIYLLSNNLVANFKQNILNDYSILIVANTPLEKDKYKDLAGIDVGKIEVLQRDKIVENLKSSLSDNSLDMLKRKLPYFYNIYLEVFPTTDELIEIKKILESDKNIKKVEVFTKNHNQVFELFVLIENISAILFLLILVFAIIIISKQVKIWFYEHHEKIVIMKLHGASTIYSASPIINYALIGALLAFIASAFSMIFISDNLNLFIPYNIKDLNIDVSMEFELVKLFFLSFFISIATIFGVLFNYSFKQWKKHYW